MADLTNDQITAGAAVLCDHGQPIGRNAAIEVFDAMRAASPQVADIAELSKAEIDAIVYQCRQQGNDTTYDIVNAAIAASRRAGGEVKAWAHEDGRVIPASTKLAAERDGGAMASSLAGYTIPLGPIATPASASAGQAAPAMRQA